MPVRGQLWSYQKLPPNDFSKQYLKIAVMKHSENIEIPFICETDVQVPYKMLAMENSVEIFWVSTNRK